MGLGLEILCLFIFFVLPRNSYFCDAQASFTSLTESNTPQAIGSDVVITAVVVTSFIPASVTWRINGVTVGSAGVNSGSTTVASEDPSTSYASRIVVSVGSFASSEFTTTLTITGLTATDNGANVVITTVGSSDASLELVVQECSLDTTAYPSLTFTCDDSPCEFNSAGTLSCAEGYTASGVSTTSTTCQADATLTNLDVLSCAASMSATTTISTDPPNNPLTTGFNNLIVTAQFPTPTDFGDSCGWLYGGELGSGNGNIYSTLGGCDPSPSNANRSITCIIDGTSHIITTLTITQPLVAGNLDIDVRCTFATNTPVPVNRTVKDCPSSLPHGIIISSSLGTYQDNATFSCPPGRELYYSNSTALQSSDTTCLANAEWSGQDNLQCWSAPDVTLTGDLNIVENDDITLTCDYDDTVIPSGTSSTFYFDNVGYTLNKDDAFSRTLQREDNMKPISCQAITPYTEVNNSTGRSLNETVNVMYAPDTVASKIELSQYTIVAKDEYLLRSDEIITMQCIYGEANPPANCNFTFHMTQSNIVSSISGCNISYDLDQSSLVSCTAGNEVGSRSSNNETITVVPAQRNLELNVTGSNITNTGEGIASYPGENVTFSCNIAFSDQLNTTYELKVSDKKLNSEQSFDLKPVKPSNTGNYSCTTMDSFGSYSSSIYLDVLYAATQDEIPTCNWNLNEAGICAVVFFSNPNSQFVSLKKNGSRVASDGSWTVESTGDQGQQSFTYNLEKVTNADEGRYELTLRSSNSSLFPNSILYFDIVIDDNPSGPSGLPTGALAGIIAGVVVVILCAAGYGIYRWRRGSDKKRGSQSNDLYSNGNGNHAEDGVTDQPGYIEFTGNNSTQQDISTQRPYEVIGLAEDENGYFAVGGRSFVQGRNGISTTQFETDNAGYIVLNGEESNAESNNQGNASSSSKRYENIEGAYDDVITAPHAESHNSQQPDGSRRYENVEGPYQEVNNS